MNVHHLGYIRATAGVPFSRSGRTGTRLISDSLRMARALLLDMQLRPCFAYTAEVVYSPLYSHHNHSLKKIHIFLDQVIRKREGVLVEILFFSFSERWHTWRRPGTGRIVDLFTRFEASRRPLCHALACYYTEKKWKNNKLMDCLIPISSCFVQASELYLTKYIDCIIIWGYTVR